MKIHLEQQHNQWVARVVDASGETLSTHRASTPGRAAELASRIPMSAVVKGQSKTGLKSEKTS